MAIQRHQDYIYLSYRLQMTMKIMMEKCCFGRIGSLNQVGRFNDQMMFYDTDAHYLIKCFTD